ncbi:hypothetical protein LMH87_001608 [Akanthomyces muscarius]|uniref:Uncharacterized protein n=1 Tax=Akanthomyces muscarius TaxID=2231603 RepID=A0A9W8UHQ4_AKAMU|nr:hypothetical protein LMH87_001608 [Akanthomyces muscarius]KAJ4147055.1 hypothetical protein LMH87_001608 [Akanthomyces muscarius]
MRLRVVCCYYVQVTKIRMPMTQDADHSRRRSLTTLMTQAVNLEARTGSQYTVKRTAHDRLAGRHGSYWNGYNVCSDDSSPAPRERRWQKDSI